MTGSWDKNIKLWDPRTNQCSGTYQQPEKVVETVFAINPVANMCLYMNVHTKSIRSRKKVFYVFKVPMN